MLLTTKPWSGNWWNSVVTLEADNFEHKVFVNGSFFVSRVSGDIKHDFSFRRDGAAGLETTEMVLGRSSENETVCRIHMGEQS